MKPPQELILDLIESAGKWNAFDGPAIAATLRTNRKLWGAVVLTDSQAGFRMDEQGELAGIDPNLAVLGALLDGSLSYDIIRAIPAPGQDEALKKMFDSMDADSVRWLRLEDSSSAFGRTTREEFIAKGYNPDHAILEAWWD